MSNLKRNETQALLQAAEESLPYGQCNTCECFLGFTAQLRIDSDAENTDLFVPYKVDRNNVHRCLGCDPCPPGDLYTQYMFKKQRTSLIMK
jgi:hypothetical protein